MLLNKWSLSPPSPRLSLASPLLLRLSPLASRPRPDLPSREPGQGVEEHVSGPGFSLEQIFDFPFLLPLRRRPFLASIALLFSSRIAILL